MAKRVAVVSLGCPSFAEALSKHAQGIEGWEFNYYPAQGLPNPHGNVPLGSTDVLWNVGLFFGVDTFFERAKAKYQIKIVNDWSGSDILGLRQVQAERPKCVQCITKSIDAHTCDWPSYKSELEDWFGIEASIVPSVPEWRPKLEPLPEKPSVLVYMPPAKQKYYYGEILKLAELFPDVPFHFIGDDAEKTLSRGNLFYHGYVKGDEREKIYKEASVALYFAVHGSFSAFLQEMLYMGRWAISTLRLPFCEYLPQDNLALAPSLLKFLLAKTEANAEGSKWMHENRTPEKVRGAVMEVLKKLEAR